MPPERLARIVAAAVEAGLSPSEAALRLGLVPEEEFYRALAAELEVPFTLRPRLGRQARFPESIAAGIAPGATLRRLVAAPVGKDLARLLAARSRRLPSLAITTPTALREAVFAVAGRRIAAEAAHRLPIAQPDFSARDGFAWPQIAAASAASAALGFLSGAFASRLATVLSLGAGALFVAMVFLRAAAALVPAPIAVAAPPRVADADLPPYTVLVALHREAEVVEDLVANLLRLDYPRGKLDIMLVLEAHDAATRVTLERLDLPPHVVILVVPPGGPGTKPRALNVALPLARGRFLVVYDAEDAPDAGQLRLAAASFAAAPAEVACLQARLGIDDRARSTWLTRFFTLEYTALFDVINPGLAHLRLPVPLGGTSNHFRIEALRAVGAWDAWNVTEDADLGIRLARLGFRVADLPSTTLEEAPATLASWMGQRVRWMKGFVQTCATHSRHPVRALRELGLFGFAGAVTMTFGTVVSAVFYPFLTAAALMMPLASPPGADTTLPEALAFAASATLFALGLAAMIGPPAIGLRRRGLLRLWPYLPLLPFYYALVSVAAWLALVELAVDPFKWNKTRHGKARAAAPPSGDAEPTDGQD